MNIKTIAKIGKEVAKIAGVVIIGGVAQNWIGNEMYKKVERGVNEIRDEVKK